MKSFVGLILICILSLIASCSKTNDTSSQVNCDGVIIDTLGTGDNARLYMPNAFTPNRDGLNDTIRPIFQNFSSLTFTVYASNGAIIYIASWPFEGWSTTIAPNSFETYSYKIIGTTSNGHHIGLCGQLYSMSCKPNNAPVLYFEDQLTPNGFTGPTSESFGVCP